MAMSSTAHYPDRLLSLSDWERLPVDERHHVELVDGVLVVAPKPTPRHQIVMGRLFSLLSQTDFVGLVATQDAEVVISEGPSGTVRAPDVLLANRHAAATQPRFAPDQVRLVIEVVSEGSRTTDRITKLHEYALAGIAEYWILDQDSATLSTFVLEAGVYQATGIHTGVVTLETCGQQVAIDLDSILSI
jgi:Uma2 family endonuclease